MLISFAQPVALKAAIRVLIEDDNVLPPASGN
jgi:hypothetical protein